MPGSVLTLSVSVAAAPTLSARTFLAKPESRIFTRPSAALALVIARDKAYTHATGSDRHEDFIGSESTAGSKRHGSSADCSAQRSSGVAMVILRVHATAEAPAKAATRRDRAVLVNCTQPSNRRLAQVSRLTGAAPNRPC